MSEVRNQDSKRGLYVSTACVGVAILCAFLVSRLGTFLMTADPLRPAQAIVVLGGHLPFRAIEAASLYHAGWAPEVWVTCGALHAEDEALARMGIDRTPEHIYSREVLQHLGVPARAIRILPERVNNTAEEVRAIAGAMGSGDRKRVILITSKYHSRRVKTIWRALGGGHDAIVRYTKDDPFNPDRWWANTGDAMAVARESFGLLNAWAGFPVKSERW
jgi:uncharacterized SAM-binding protein YcdF (DUF218 family)